MFTFRIRAGLAACALPTLAALGLAALLPQAATAQTLYADSFTTGTPGTSLNGHAPQVDATGATYTVTNLSGGDVQYATGDAVFTPQGNLENVFLPVTTNGASIYSVSAFVTPPVNPAYTLNVGTSLATNVPANSDWVAIGFATSLRGANETEFNYAGPWMLYTAKGDVGVFGGPGTNNSSGIPGTNTTPVPATETVVYNAATGVATFELDGAPVGTYTYGIPGHAAAPNITEAFIGEYEPVYNTTQATFTALTVTATPEPSQLAGLAMGALSLAGLALKARRRAA